MAPINIIALQPGSSSNALNIETEDAVNVGSNKMQQLCIQVPYATSPANPIWLQDIMRAKAGTSDG